MTVFKTFLKILNKCKMPIIIYTVFLIFFGGFNMQNVENTASFVASKPDVVIINCDKDSSLADHMISYLEDNFEIKDISPDMLDDALFYRDVNYIIEIPTNFESEFLKGNDPEIIVKSTGDYQASLAEMVLTKYLEIAKIYAHAENDVDKLLKDIDETLMSNTPIEVTSSLDAGGLEKATFFYNFLNYCLLAGSIYVISLVLSIFKNEKINKRTIVSSTDYREINHKLLFANGLFAFALWAIYVVLSLFLVGDVLLSTHGLLYMANSLIFSFCALSIAFLLGNLGIQKEAVNGIVNVIALGSSFLCGAFVPMEWLPASVLKFAHILPSYWFISSNEMIKRLENINLDTLMPIFGNTVIIILFSIFFIILTNAVSKRKRKID